jgi:hypothetical protein
MRLVKTALAMPVAVTALDFDQGRLRAALFFRLGTYPGLATGHPQVSRNRPQAVPSVITGRFYSLALALSD